MIRLRNVLVATDFSEPSALALAYGRELAHTYGAALHVLSVVEDVLVHYSPEMGFHTPEMYNELERIATRELNAAITDDDRRTLKVVSAVRIGGSIAVGIVDYAKEHDIDVILVGTHGRGGMKRLLMGSVAERVVRTAPCPVLTVRAPEHDFIVPEALRSAATA